MKKSILCASAAVLSAFLLAGCSTTASNSSSSSSTSSSKVAKSSSSSSSKKAAKQTAGAKMKDGTYKLVEDNYDHGYKVEVSITVKNNKITDSSYDQVNKKGVSKTKDAAYEKQMKKISGIGPKEYIPKLAKELSSTQADASGIQVVSGATHSSNTLRNYFNQLIQAAQKGDTDTIHINNNGKLKDGTYKLEQTNYDHGYRQVFTLTVKNNKISHLDYDQVNKKGVSKAKDAAYEKQMKKVNGIGPKEYIAKLNKEFNKSKDANVQVVSGATHSSNSFTAYVGQLINAAENGDTKTIKVDNIIYSE